MKSLDSFLIQSLEKAWSIAPISPFYVARASILIAFGMSFLSVFYSTDRYVAFASVCSLLIIACYTVAFYSEARVHEQENTKNKINSAKYTRWACRLGWLSSVLFLIVCFACNTEKSNESAIAVVNSTTVLIAEYFVAINWIMPNYFVRRYAFEYMKNRSI